MSGRMSGGWLSDHKEMLLAGVLVIVVFMAAYAIVHGIIWDEGKLIIQTGTITVSQMNATEATVTFGDFDPDARLYDVMILIENGTTRSSYEFDKDEGCFVIFENFGKLDEANTGEFLIASNTSWNHTVQPGDFCTFRISSGNQYKIQIVIQGDLVADARLDT